MEKGKSNVYIKGAAPLHSDSLQYMNYADVALSGAAGIVGGQFR